MYWLKLSLYCHHCCDRSCIGTRNCKSQHAVSGFLWVLLFPSTSLFPHSANVTYLQVAINSHQTNYKWVLYVLLLFRAYAKFWIYIGLFKHYVRFSLFYVVLCHYFPDRMNTRMTHANRNLMPFLTYFIIKSFDCKWCRWTSLFLYFWKTYLK